MEYLEWLGQAFGQEQVEKYQGQYTGRRLHLKQALAAIRAYELELSHALLDVLEESPGVTVCGLTDRRRLEERVPTFSYNLKGWHLHVLAERLGKEGIYVWDGNY